MNNKFVTKQTYEGHKIQTYPIKGSQNFKNVQVRLLFKLCETSITSQMLENVCNIVLLLIAADCFSQIIAFKLVLI